jgi:hypothetical protein
MTTEAQREQRLRHETLENDRRVREQQRGSTFAEFATAEAAEDRGRFTSHEKSFVIGSTENPATAYPAAFLQRDPVPKEEPLNYDVNAMEPVGTAAEVQASIDKLPKPEDDEPPCAA